MTVRSFNVARNMFESFKFSLLISNIPGKGADWVFSMSNLLQIQQGNIQGGSGHWTVNYTGTQGFITTFVGSKTLGIFIELWLAKVFKIFTNNFN